MTVTIKAWVIWFLYLALCFYCIIDAYHTTVLVGIGAHELNPLINWLVAVTGTWHSVYLVKIGALAFLGIMLATLCVKRKEKKVLPEGREMRHYSYY